ncbi:unnamed protein product, partial [Acidithrix sp. C25]
VLITFPGPKAPPDPPLPIDSEVAMILRNGVATIIYKGIEDISFS